MVAVWVSSVCPGQERLLIEVDEYLPTLPSL